MSPPPPPSPPVQTRPVYGTESSWFRAVPGGTGVTALSVFINSPLNIPLLQTALHKLQHDHPILRAKLHVDPTRPFSLLIPPSSSLTVHSYDPQSTAKIIRDHNGGNLNLTPFHVVVEHDVNQNPWRNLDSDGEGEGEGVDVMHASAYEIGVDQWTVVIKLNSGACDRTAAVQLMTELMEMLKKNNDEGGAHYDDENDEEGEIGLGIEEYIPSEKTSKPLWARGVDMLGYSLNSFRLSNLNFVDPDAQRSSRVVRLVLDDKRTSLLLQGCKTRGIKLCGALSAAGLIAARLCKGISDGEWEKYAIVTLIDCREELEPRLTSRHVGFYQAAVLNTHDMNGSEELWGLARRTYKSVEDAKKCNKHFSDMADLNFLMCKAIENPGLTPSSSLRTSFMSVFEDPIIDEVNDTYGEIRMDDYMGSSSVHGAGPSVAIFDTIRGGKLDCACVYPFPLHSRQQMQEFIDNMKKILIDCCSSENQ